METLEEKKYFSVIEIEQIGAKNIFVFCFPSVLNVLSGHPTYSYQSGLKYS